jgi:hypothetical protein
MDFHSPQQSSSAYTSHDCGGLCSAPGLFINISALLIALAVKLLGFLLDSKLSWEPHVRWLCVKFERSLNILKILSGRCWGEDKMIMVRLCRALTCTNIDYMAVLCVALP